jgi:WD40 repeat protein
MITCSLDGSLQIWDLARGTQIGDDWRDSDQPVDEQMMLAIALSRNGTTIASGGGSRSSDGRVRLWDVEIGKVIVRWIGIEFPQSQARASEVIPT